MVKAPALSQLWLSSLLWCEFNPWPGNFLVLQVKPKEKREKYLYKKILNSANVISWLETVTQEHSAPMNYMLRRLDDPSR